jgi:hypothetical protein
VRAQARVELHNLAGLSYCSITSLPEFARSRDGCALWRANARNGASGKTTQWPNGAREAARVTFTHVYTGSSKCLDVESGRADRGQAAAKRPAGQSEGRGQRQGEAKRQRHTIDESDEDDGDDDDDVDPACVNDEAIARALSAY